MHVARSQEREVFGAKLSEDAAGRQGGYGGKWCLRHARQIISVFVSIARAFCRWWPGAEERPPVRPPPRRRRARVCKGFSDMVGCLFSQRKMGQPVQDPFGGEKCLFCDPERMAAACNSVKGRSNISKALKAFRASYEQQSYVYNAAVMRVPEEWQDKFHAEALKEKRGQPKQQRQPRNAAVDQQVKTAAEAWKTALASRKRAFKELASKEVTAYKKRRAADRTRVAKKFFLDNDLPKLEAKDIADNDAGLPMPTVSARAAFVEQWCKFGSWAICKKCSSLQPRPLEPVDTRRVAPAEMTAKKCKQCSGKQWVPQPHELPKVLRKLSLKLSKVLRPLDIDVGPVKKANNGYRIHSSMTRLSWSKKSVEEKIRKARGDTGSFFWR